jgi:hypothetical protein
MMPKEKQLRPAAAAVSAPGLSCFASRVSKNHATGLRQNSPTGKSLRRPRKAVSSPISKNILIFRRRKSV